MSERTEYAPGPRAGSTTPRRTRGAAAEFYSQLFGWETEDVMPAEQDGEYHMARCGARTSPRSARSRWRACRRLEHLRHGRATPSATAGDGQGGGRQRDDGAVRRLRGRPDGRLRRPVGRRVHGLEAEPDRSAPTSSTSRARCRGTSCRPATSAGLEGVLRQGLRLAERRRWSSAAARTRSGTRPGSSRRLGQRRRRHDRDDVERAVAGGRPAVLARLLRRRRHRRDGRQGRGARAAR